MLEIKETKSVDNYINQIKKYGADEGSALVFEAQSGGELLGYGFCVLNGESIVFKELSAADKNIYEGLLRAMLNSADLRGIHSAVFEIEDLNKVKSLCELEKGNILPEIGTFFDKKCCNNS